MASNPETAGESYPHHHAIYDKLVNDPGDLVGMVAYAMYKRQKRECIKRHIETSGAPPDDVVMVNIHAALSTPSGMDAYREHAESIMEAYASELQKGIAGALLEKLSRQYEARYSETIRAGLLTHDKYMSEHLEEIRAMVTDAVRTAQPGIARTILFGALSSVVVAVCVITMGFFAAGSVTRFLVDMTRKAEAYQMEQANAEPRRPGLP